MNNGTILLYKFHKSKNILINITGKSIKFFTSSDYVHTAIYLNGKTYSEEVWKENKKWKSGVKITNGMNRADVYLEPIYTLTECQVYAMEIILKNFYETKGYNFLKLISLAIVYPLRWFFKKIG